MRRKKKVIDTTVPMGITKRRKQDKICDYLSSCQAAELLGITKTTLANWDKKGKLKAHRNPINGFKLYRLKDIHSLLDELEASGSTRGRSVGKQ
jgi:MerR family copper efflux transcriptional regulator